jgi:GT2 family glycosyltransferase
VKSVSVVMPVLAPTPWLVELAKFAITTLRMRASAEFELIICEAKHHHLDPDRWKFDNNATLLDPEVPVEKYLGFPDPIGGVKEINAGIDAATGDYILLAGTDLIAPQGWDDELLRVFHDHADCGVAALSAFEPNATIGPPCAVDLVVEGMFSPFMMIKNGEGWRFDEDYQRIYQDSDLILRLYQAGKRAYRSCRKHVWHLGSVTNTQAGAAHEAMHAKALAHDERLFYERWGKSPLAMFGMIRGGRQVYGREHEAFLCQIDLHYDPFKAEG